MAGAAKDLSFYFFDLDDNVLFLKTRVFVRKTTKPQEERALSTGEFALVQPLLGRPGLWEDFALFEGTYRDFRDHGKRGVKQPFVRDIEDAIATPGTDWQAPSWPLFVYACRHQRPVSIVTARGHAPRTIKEGVRA